MTKQEIRKQFQVGTKLIYSYKEGKQIFVVKKIHKDYIKFDQKYLTMDVLCIHDTITCLEKGKLITHWRPNINLILTTNHIKIIPPLEEKINKLLKI